MSTPNDLTLSLAPWPEPDPSETSVATLIPLIQSQRGHFKDLSETSLLAEIASPPPATPPPSSPSSEAAATTTTVTEDALTTAKTTMLTAISAAHNEALLALDYISLLSTLHTPDAAAATMSPHLRAAVPTASLAYDKIPLKPTPADLATTTGIARAWKSTALTTAATRLRAASSHLGTQVKKEATYWSHVLAIKDAGWVITRMPTERGVLGVEYGFVEAGAEYPGKGIGALRMSADGGVVMDDVHTTGAHKNTVLRTRIVDADTIRGVSSASTFTDTSLLPTDTSPRAMIARARNFIYDDELFFELQREARGLASAGIETSENSVTLTVSPHRRIILDMAPLNAPTPTLPENPLAETITTALRLLLSHAHRLNLAARSLPPPPLSAHKKPTPPLPLLRPVATHLLHHLAVQELAALLSHTAQSVRKAGLVGSFAVHPWRSLSGAEFTSSQKTAEVFLTPAVSQGNVVLPGGWRVGVVVRTQAGAPAGYTCSASHDGVAAGLQGEVRCIGFEEVRRYVRWCCERAVVNEMRGWGWELEVRGGNEVRRVKEGKGRRVRVEMGAEGVTVRFGVAGGVDGSAVWGEEGRGLQEVVEEV